MERWSECVLCRYEAVTVHSRQEWYLVMTRLLFGVLVEFQNIDKQKRTVPNLLLIKETVCNHWFFIDWRSSACALTVASNDRRFAPNNCEFSALRLAVFDWYTYAPVYLFVAYNCIPWLCPIFFVTRYNSWRRGAEDSNRVQHEDGRLGTLWACHVDVRYFRTPTNAVCSKQSFANTRGLVLWRHALPVEGTFECHSHRTAISGFFCLYFTTKFCWALEDIEWCSAPYVCVSQSIALVYRLTHTACFHRLKEGVISIWGWTSSFFPPGVELFCRCSMCTKVRNFGSARNWEKIVFVIAWATKLPIVWPFQAAAPSLNLKLWTWASLSRVLFGKYLHRVGTRTSVSYWPMNHTVLILTFGTT